MAALPLFAGSYEPQHQFSSAMDQVWQFSEQNQVCLLSTDISEYGQARFVADAGTRPAFELQAFKDWHEPGPISVSRYAPGWHPAAGLRESLGNLSHVEGGGAAARGALAGNMLMALREGLHLEIAAPAWSAPHEEVIVQLGAKDLRPALLSFLACAHTNVKVSWQEMSRTRISYAVDQHDLDDDDRARLRSLARYVLEDSSIDKLYIDGHTDASGLKVHNLKLAKQRAETVAAYLVECGLQKSQIVIRYHGANYPVADNKTAAGKAQNRRTTVRLERAPAQNIAVK